MINETDNSYSHCEFVLLFVFLSATKRPPLQVGAFFFFFFCKKVKLEKKDRSFFYGYSKRDLDRVFKVLKCKSCCTYSSFSAFYIVSSVGCTRVHLASLIYLLSVFSFVYFILCNLYRGKLYRIIRQILDSSACHFFCNSFSVFL